jgi:hypothetical protein
MYNNQIGNITQRLDAQQQYGQGQLQYYDYQQQAYVQRSVQAGPVNPGSSGVTNLKPNPKEENMVTEVMSDTKKFLKDHKSIIYWVAILLVADHVLFNGAFKEKLKNIMSQLVGKVEDKLKESNIQPSTKV